MSRPLKLGLIGAGMIGDAHIRSARADGRADFVHIAARTKETLTAKMKTHGIAKGTLDYREVLADPSVEAVVIATPPHLHPGMTAAALDAGKHILLEKPMAADPAGVARIVSAVRAHPDRIVLECSCRHARLQPRFALVKRIIDGGKLGEIYHIHHSVLMRRTFVEWNPAGAWALDSKQAGGGPFLDMGVYDLSFHLGLLDDKPALRSLTAFTRGGLKTFRDPAMRQDVEEHGAAWMELDGGLSYYYERGAGVQCESPNETRIHGSKGTLRFGFLSWDPPVVDWYHGGAGGEERMETLNVDYSRHPGDDRALMSHFLDCLEGKSEPLMTVDLAAKHMDILFRILGKAG
jgi:predicted dehydrogenase